MKAVLRQTAFYGMVIAGWLIIARLHIWPPYLFPPPQGVLESLWGVVESSVDESIPGCVPESEPGLVPLLPLLLLPQA